MAIATNIDFPTNSALFVLGSSNSATFTLMGGTYQVAASATWSAGNIDLQVLGPDGVTFLSVLPATFTVNGTKVIQTPPGTYKFVVTTATAAFGSVYPIRLT